jgi:hypothetical protein
MNPEAKVTGGRHRQEDREVDLEISNGKAGSG